MNKLLITTAVIGTLTLTTLDNVEAAMKKPVIFESHNQTLVGNLYLPDDYKDGDKLPGVVVTGAWTTVKEQMPTTYATELADKGYAALVFDFRGWGESEDSIKYLEDPKRKTQDINAAVNYLVTRSEVDANKVAGLGICASAGYMSDAAASNPNIKSLALVAPWLHNAAIVDAVYGGEESVDALITAAKNAKKAYEPVYLEAASLTNKNAVMYQAPYYTEENRGLIAEYDNKFNVVSWDGWLTYDALKTADAQEKPALLVHSDAAAIPQGAKEYAARAGDNVELIMLNDVTQFDFYDQPEAVNTATNAVVEHFKKTLK
ncbi:MAG: alpha/beta hydrolase [Pseudomonadota bacterium]